jgi:hypothetical protein
MKNTILFHLLFLLLAVNANAQQFMIQAGINGSGMVEKTDSYVNDDLIYIPRFHLGAVVEFEMSDNMNLQTGLLLINRGYRYKLEIPDSSYKYLETTNIYYLDVPVLFKLHTTVGNAELFALGGGYLGFGLKTLYQEKLYDKNDFYRSNYFIEFGDDENDNIKKTDFGLVGGLGVEFSDRHIIQFSVDFGLANISPLEDNGYKEQNRVYKLSYLFILNP